MARSAIARERAGRYSVDMEKNFTTADVAAKRGCSSSTVRRAAAAHGIGLKVGRDWIFGQSDVDQLCAVIRDEPGNPEFSQQGQSRRRRRS